MVHRVFVFYTPIMNPLKCSVCIDPNDQKNPIVSCKSCGVYIHALCYGIDTKKESTKNWLCSPCKVNALLPSCELCLQNNGAMKKTSCGNWVHVICALFTTGVIIENKNKMEPINLSGIPHTKRNKKCAYCLRADGFCSYCSKNDCPERIHITCAQQNGCTIEIVDKKDKIDFRAYCMEHQPTKPSKSKRRVSSKFLQEIAAQKENGNAKTNNQKTSNANADWILNVSSMISKSTEVQNTVSHPMNVNNKRLVDEVSSGSKDHPSKKSKLKSATENKENAVPNPLIAHENVPTNINKPSTPMAVANELNIQSKSTAQKVDKRSAKQEKATAVEVKDKSKSNALEEKHHESHILDSSQGKIYKLD